VSLPHFDFTLPANCFHYPLILSSFITPTPHAPSAFLMDGHNEGNRTAASDQPRFTGDFVELTDAPEHWPFSAKVSSSWPFRTRALCAFGQPRQP
jgi:hypothetical protein